MRGRVLVFYYDVWEINYLHELLQELGRNEFSSQVQVCILRAHSFAGETVEEYRWVSVALSLVDSHCYLWSRANSRDRLGGL